MRVREAHVKDERNIGELTYIFSAGGAWGHVVIPAHKMEIVDVAGSRKSESRNGAT